MNTKILTSALAAVALSGCTITLPLGEHHPVAHFSAAETVFQLANATDFATTVTIARSPDCYHEAGYPTHNIIGAHPSTRGVIEYGAALGLLHAGISSWLENEVDATDATGWKVAQRVFQVVSIGEAVYNVQNNLRIGLKPFGGNACKP